MSSIKNHSNNYQNLINIDFNEDTSSRKFISKLFLSEISTNIHKTSHNLGTYTNQLISSDFEKDLVKLLPINGVNFNEYSIVGSCKSVCLNAFSEMLKNKNIEAEYTIGSSEALAMAMSFMLSLWRTERKKCPSPEIILGQNSHTHIAFIASLLGIKVRYAGCNDGIFKTTAASVKKLLKPNVIGIILTAGNTFTGEVDDINQINTLLTEYRIETGINIPIHIDGAIGGFVLPFTSDNNDCGFNLSNVYSLNISSHKYGFTYPSLGWYIYKKDKFTMSRQANYVDYLQGKFQISKLNFSHSVYNLVFQSHNFLKYGYKGYEAIMHSLISLRNYAKGRLSQINGIEILKNDTDIPVIIFRLENDQLTRNFSEKLFSKGWSVPCYKISNKNFNICRIVVRKGMNKELFEDFVSSIEI